MTTSGPRRRSRCDCAARSLPDTQTPSLTIKPHESLKQHAQRVEQHLRPGIHAIAKQSRGEAKGRARKSKEEGAKPKSVKVVEPEPEEEVREPEPIEFAHAPRLRLHDIVDQPPTLSLKRKASKAISEPTDRVPASRAPISLAQREAIERERESAIKRCVVGLLLLTLAAIER